RSRPDQQTVDSLQDLNGLISLETLHLKKWDQGANPIKCIYGGYGFPHRQWRSIPTIAARRLCQTLHSHLRLKAEFFLGFGNVGHSNLGKQQHTRYRHCILETNAYHLSGIDDAGLDQIDVLLACGIEAIIPLSP